MISARFSSFQIGHCLVSNWSSRPADADGSAKAAVLSLVMEVANVDRKPKWQQAVGWIRRVVSGVPC